MTWFVVALVVVFFVIAARALRADLADMRRFDEQRGCTAELTETGILQHPTDSCPVCPNKIGEGEA